MVEVDEERIREEEVEREEKEGQEKKVWGSARRRGRRWR